MGAAQKLRKTMISRRGVHPPARKETKAKKIAPGPQPEHVVIPLLQHVGVECEPVVHMHDTVKVGQILGDSEAYLCSPVHSSVSGEVTAIRKHPHPTGRDILSVFVESDGRFEMAPWLNPPGDPGEMAPAEIRRQIRKGGIVGMGGAGFPTHAKLSPPSDKNIELFIVNGAECEPYLTGDDRLMMERAGDIVAGAMVVKKTVGADRIAAGIEENKPRAIEAMKEAGAPYGVEVVVLPERYPQGAERTLIYAVTGKKLGAGRLPMDLGIIVDNVATCLAIKDYFDTGVPLVERVVTVSGNGVADRGNFTMRLGTLFQDVIDFCGGLVGEPGKIIMGGPMMGISQYTTSVPVTKSTSGITVLRGETLFTKEQSQFSCIRCSTCVKVCPMNLMPYRFGAYADAGMWDRLDRWDVETCMECGSCAYVCPTKNPLVQLIKVGKEGLARKRSKMEELEKTAGGED